jgi:RNA polymerase sigma-70 factor (ECF subfamily)
MDDAARIRACIGDECAFDALYRTHAPRLYAWLRRETRDDVALELVAETFAQVLVSAHRFRGEDDTAAAAWLNGIARNLLRGYRRRARVEDRARRKLEIEEAVRAAIADEVVAPALDVLPDGERRAVELRVLDELPYDEVAGQLGIKEQAARARVSRGLRRLRGET